MAHNQNGCPECLSRQYSNLALLVAFSKVGTQAATFLDLAKIMLDLVHENSTSCIKVTTRVATFSNEFSALQLNRKGIHRLPITNVGDGHIFLGADFTSALG